MSLDQNKQIHDLIISKLDLIQAQTTKTNGRVSTLEKELVDAKNDIAEALRIISGHSTIIKYYKEESDKAKDQLIENQAKKIERDAEEKERRDTEEKNSNKRIMYGSVIAIVIILGTLGLLNINTLKLIL
jgi:hypothetical protein